MGSLISPAPCWLALGLGMSGPVTSQNRRRPLALAGRRVHLHFRPPAPGDPRPGKTSSLEPDQEMSPMGDKAPKDKAKKDKIKDAKNSKEKNAKSAKDAAAKAAVKPPKK
jgi:hypothetical protein